ncbi:MAG: hypothetical protein ACP5LD_06540, partial [Desulfomonilaceae bacterium]
RSCGAQYNRPGQRPGNAVIESHDSFLQSQPCCRLLDMRPKENSLANPARFTFLRSVGIYETGDIVTGPRVRMHQEEGMHAHGTD